MADSTATELSYFFKAMQEDREGWLGKDGLVISDGAFAGADWVLTPYPGKSLTNKQQWYNFCLSSTRMYVEQVFGQWKSRWRVLIKESQCSHKTMSQDQVWVVLFLSRGVGESCQSVLQRGSALSGNWE